MLNSDLSVVVFYRPPPPASLHFRVVQMLLFAAPAPALRGRRWRLTSADQQTSGGCNYLVSLSVEEGEADIWFMLEWPSW